MSLNSKQGKCLDTCEFSKKISYWGCTPNSLLRDNLSRSYSGALRLVFNASDFLMLPFKITSNNIVLPTYVWHFEGLGISGFVASKW